MSVPQHSATAPITFLSTAAFDAERVAKEMATMSDGGAEHPVVIYAAGRSRYDLDAPYPVGEELRRARDYLRVDHTCPTWSLKRLGAVATARLHDIGGEVAALDALCKGFEAVSIEVPGFKPIAGRQLSEHQINQLADHFGLDEVVRAGEAVLKASASPTASEGKR